MADDTNDNTSDNHSTGNKVPPNHPRQGNPYNNKNNHTKTSTGASKLTKPPIQQQKVIVKPFTLNRLPDSPDHHYNYDIATTDTTTGTPSRQGKTYLETLTENYSPMLDSPLRDNANATTTTANTSTADTNTTSNAPPSDTQQNPSQLTSDNNPSWTNNTTANNDIANADDSTTTPTFITKTLSTHWFIFEIPKAYHNEHHRATAILDILQACSTFDKRVQFLPKESTPDHNANRNYNRRHQHSLPPPEPLRCNKIPQPFTDDNAMQYMSRTYENTKVIGTAQRKKSTTFIHTEIELKTYAHPLDLAHAVNDFFRQHHPKSKTIIHPLNSQKPSTIGYLHLSTANINLKDLQQQITSNTQLLVRATFDNIERFIDKSATRDTNRIM